jgi:hypothetical protein
MVDFGERIHDLLADVGNQGVHIDTSDNDSPEDSSLLLTTFVELTESESSL